MWLSSAFKEARTLLSAVSTSIRNVIMRVSRYARWLIGAHSSREQVFGPVRAPFDGM